MQLAATPRLCAARAANVAAPRGGGQPQPLTGGYRGVLLRVRAEGAGQGMPGMPDRGDRHHRPVADSDEEYLPSDAEADVPVPQRLASRDMYREMANLPPEYPPEPGAAAPDTRLVAETVSDEEELLPDSPLDLDEEMITDTKPFIGDVYNETAGVVRRARPNAPSAASAEGQPQGLSNRPPGAASSLSSGQGIEEDDREARKAAAEAEVTDMKHGPGSAQGAEGGSDRPSADSPAVAAAAEEGSLKEGWPAAAKGGTGGSATASAGGGAGAAQGLPDQPQAEGSLKEGGVAVTDQLAVQAAEEAREEEAGGGGKEAGGRGQQEEDPNTSARRSAMDMMGGIDRPEKAGFTLFMDKKEQQ